MSQTKGAGDKERRQEDRNGAERRDDGRAHNGRQQAEREAQD